MAAVVVIEEERCPVDDAIRVAHRNPRDGGPRWIYLAIAQAQLLSPRVKLPEYCEAPRHHGKRRIASAFHVVINVPGEPDRAWVAYADCTRLMMEAAEV